MEQSEKKKQAATEEYRRAEADYNREFGALVKVDAETNRRIEELQRDRDKAVTFEPAGPEPVFGDYVWNPIKAVLAAGITAAVLYYLGKWLLFGNILTLCKLADGVFIKSILVLVGVAVVAAVAGYLMYRSRRQQWEVDSEVYRTSDYKKAINELRQCEKTLDDNNEKIAELLHKRGEELLAYSDGTLEELIASGDRIFQNELEQAFSRSNHADEKCKELTKEADNIIIKKLDAEPDYGNVSMAVLIMLGALVVLFAVHCLIWVLKLMFDISWDTWGWMCKTLIWGLPIMVAWMTIAGLIRCTKVMKWRISSKEHAKKTSLKKEFTKKAKHYDKLAEDLYNEICLPLIDKRDVVLRVLMNRNLSLPIRNLGDWNWHEAFDTYFSMLDEQKYIQTLPPAERTAAVFDFFDKKLKLFYERSIKSEAGDVESLYEPFEWALSNKPIKELRNNYTPAAASKKHVNRLVDKNDNFIDIDSVCEDFVDLVNVDTSGMFLEHDSKKVEKKTKEMQRCYNDFAESVNGFGKLVEQINESLGMARMVAYRNLYLGAELVNIVHETGSGGTLTRTDDVLSGLSANSVQVSGIEAVGFTKTAVDILDSSLGAVAVAVDNVLSNKAATKYYKKNPKEALATAAGVAVVAAVNSAIEAWNERNERIERCLATQKELVDKMDETVEQFLDSQAKAARALELIGALVKVNNGFMAVYEPLREKVFVDHKPSDVTMKELQQLVLAIKDYKSISDAKL